MSVAPKLSNSLNIYESKVGSYKGEIPRITLETKRLENTGFIAGTKIDVIYKRNKIIVSINKDGTRQITSRRGKQVLDIKSKEIKKAFVDINLVKVIVGRNTIEISPLKEAISQRRARDKIKANKRFYGVVDMFCSGGTLAKCFSDNKRFKIIAGIDYDDKKLETYQANNPDAEIWCGDIAKVEWERYLDAAVVSVTPSCRPFTPANKTGKKKEEAPEGDNTAFALVGISIIRPAIVLLEEVPSFVNSYSYFIFKHMLTKMGYQISEKILRAKEFNSLSFRRRLCMVASIKEGFKFLPIKPILPKTVQDILEIPLKERKWMRTLGGHEAWEEKQLKKGNNFRMHLVNENSTSVRHPTTRYYDRQTSSFLVNDKGEKDFFTSRELARVASIPDNFILPDDAKEAVSIIGDGVEYESFSYAVKCIEEHLR